MGCLGEWLLEPDRPHGVHRWLVATRRDDRRFPWVSTWGPNSLVAAAGPNNSISLIFAETYNPVVGRRERRGPASLWYATKPVRVVGLQQDREHGRHEAGYLVRGRPTTPRDICSLAVDSPARGLRHVHADLLRRRSVLDDQQRSLLRDQQERFLAVPSRLRSAGRNRGCRPSGASIAISPTGQVAIAGYFVEPICHGVSRDSPTPVLHPKRIRWLERTGCGLGASECRIRGRAMGPTTRVSRLNYSSPPPATPRSCSRMSLLSILANT